MIAESATENAQPYPTVNNGAGAPPAASATHSSGWWHPRVAAWGLLFFAGILVADARYRDRGGFDYDLINAVRTVGFPGDRGLFEAFSDLTGTYGLIAVWALAGVGFLLLRRWLAVAILFAFPLGAIISSGLQGFVGRPGPDLARIDGLESVQRVANGNDLSTFPSGQVIGAVLLYGFLFVLARELTQRRVRWSVRALVLLVILGAGSSRVWLGSHWVGDVATAYALGGAILIAVAGFYRRALPYAAGLPLLHAARIPIDSTERHVHALTSTIVFRADTVAKSYAPGFIPTAIYWLAFQAPFGYAYNEAARVAAVHRRNLAGLLTEYWFGERRVARALGLGDVGGRPAIVSEWIDGAEPRDIEAARRFLFELCDRFDEVGLPTWQIDPRQPRSLGNVLELADGRLVVVDLESGLVSPLASPRAWARGLSRGLLPMYDDVMFDVARAYIQREEPAMRGRLGDEWLEELQRTLDRSEQAAIAWHVSEPRMWSRGLCWVLSGFGVPGLRRRLRRTRARSNERAELWIEQAIARWEAEGHVSHEEAVRLHETTTAPDFQAVIPHFAVHLAIGVVLRFPFGSITRLSYTGGQLLVATGRLLMRRIDRPAWRRATSIHSPLVMVIAAMPGVGTFSYLAARPVRTNPTVLRIVIDEMAERLPGRLYEQSGLRRRVQGHGGSSPRSEVRSDHDRPA